MKIQYFRYFLNAAKQPDMFPSTEDKNDIFIRLIQEKMEYQNGKNELIYVCHNKVDKLLHAKLGKKSSIKKNIPSEDDFVEQEEEDYPNCNIIFYLDKNPNLGQTIAFEYINSIFSKPEKQLKKFEEIVNKKLHPSGYALSISSIDDERNFWKIIEKNDGQIEKLSFSYAVPNLFNLKNTLSEDLKESSERYGITNTTIELENKNGKLNISTDDQLIKESVEYTEKGGGEFKLKIIGSKTEIKSKDAVKTETFDFEISSDDKSTFKEACSQIINKL